MSKNVLHKANRNSYAYEGLGKVYRALWAQTVSSLPAIVLPLLMVGACSSRSLAFTDPLGVFSIGFPAAPEQTSRVLRYEGQDLPMTVYKTVNAQHLYTLAYTDYPPGLFDPTKVESMLDAAVENAVLSVDGHLLIQERITRQACSGRRVRILVTQGADRAHLVLESVMDHDRIYIYGVACSPEDSYGTVVNSFLDSFRILRHRNKADGISAEQASAPLHTYKKYDIKNLGTLEVSDRMELQGGAFLALSKSYASTTGVNVVNDDDAIFQQPGVNDFLPHGKDTYVRLMLRTVVGERAEYATLNDPLNLTQEQIGSMDRERRAVVENDMRKMGMGMTLEKWDGLRISTINGYKALHFGYIRRLGTKPPVRVEEYMVQNMDRVHYITVSYRIEDRDIWWPALQRSLSTLQIRKSN